jgi:sigma-B regulation protein RsbU (phosphoserine phosphatase)
MGQNGSLRILDVHGPVIGTGGVHSYSKEKVQLKSGDKVILYTDGILDYSNVRGEFFGKQRLLRILGQFAASPVQILMDMVQESIKNFAEAASPSDDTSIMAIEYVE